MVSDCGARISSGEGENPFDRDWVRYAQSPGEARRRGRNMDVIWPDWDRKKQEAMLEVVRAKFRVKVLAEKLLATGDEELVEHNRHGDTYWGKYIGKGYNYLGEILMKVRQELKND